MEEELPRVELGGGGFFGGKLVISAPGWSDELEIELDLEPLALIASSSVSIQFRRIFSVKAPIVSDFSAELIMKQAYLFFSPSYDFTVALRISSSKSTVELEGLA